MLEWNPKDINETSGYSDLDQADVPIYYGAEGPGRLYLRGNMMNDDDAQLGNIHMYNGALDLWCFDNSGV